VRKDHKPYWLKSWLRKCNGWYCEHFIKPQFDALGTGAQFLNPSSCQIHGANIRAGNFLHLISHPLKPVRLTTWSDRQGNGFISLGDYCLIAPGVEITSAVGISIGSNSMIAADCMIHDSDWHGLYNRARPFRCTAPVTLGDNVWLGTRVIVCKGVSIGDNSVIGAGSVVASDIPANVVAAGNPARVIKYLSPQKRMLKRDFLFRRGDVYWQNQYALDEYVSHKNGLLNWLRTLIFPKRFD
jgi:acetyltransferase-like isoleucine patch superfamily enzyme